LDTEHCAYSLVIIDSEFIRRKEKIKNQKTLVSLCEIRVFLIVWGTEPGLDRLKDFLDMVI
jgi:hypothetical protein